MKERPILFSTEMVKAILDGRKTMTRRVVKDPYKYITIPRPSPYGRVGDRLWVRETFVIDADGMPDYRADCDSGVIAWRPSIFMPRKLSRITLEITSVRVERLQEITEEDAIKEGAGPGHILCSPTIFNPETETPKDYRTGFSYLWDAINRKTYPWESNPWVWVISFRLTGEGK